MGSSEPRAILSADTSAAAEDIQVRRWREMSAADKARVVTQLSAAATTMALAGIQYAHPAASARECFLRLAVRRLGRDLAMHAYPEIARLSNAP
jgi:hypothetical protein